MDTLSLVRTVESFFTKEECESIIDSKERYNLEPATTYGEYRATNKVDDQFRIGNVGWIDVDSFPYTERIKEFIAEYNKLEKFILNDRLVLQFSEYFPGAKFNRHQDVHLDITQRFGFEDSRKISMTFQLSDEDEYTGGDLIITTGITDKGSLGYPISRKQGSATAFPSYYKHQVNEIKTGTRYSLVAWVHGPHWK